MSDDILGTNCDQCLSMVQCWFTSTETVRLTRTESLGRPPRPSHSSWTRWSSVESKMVFMRSEKSIIIRFTLPPEVSAALCTFLLPLADRGGLHKLPWTFSRLIPSTQTCNQLAKCLLTTIVTKSFRKQRYFLFVLRSSSFIRSKIIRLFCLSTRSFTQSGDNNNNNNDSSNSNMNNKETIL